MVPAYREMLDVLMSPASLHAALLTLGAKKSFAMESNSCFVGRLVFLQPVGHSPSAFQGLRILSVSQAASMF